MLGNPDLSLWYAWAIVIHYSEKFMKKMLSLLSLLSVLSFSALAQDIHPMSFQDTKNTQPVLKAKLLFVDKNQFIQAWTKEGIPEIKTINTLHRGEKMTAVIVFAGCKVVADKCNVSADYIIHIPGHSDILLNDKPIWQRAPLQQNLIMLGDSMIESKIDPTDPFGNYQMDVKLKDNNSHAVVNLHENFKVENANNL